MVQKTFVQSEFSMRCHLSDTCILCLTLFSTFCTADRSDNFVVGLTNVSPLATAPTLWKYAVCGQYPGPVADGATVSLKCNCSLPASRYVIIQFPIDGYANLCELEVYIRRKFIALLQLVLLLISVDNQFTRTIHVVSRGVSSCRSLGWPVAWPYL